MNKFQSKVLSRINELNLRPLKIRELAKALGFATNEYIEFRTAIKELTRIGKLAKIRGGRIGKAEPLKDAIVGTLSMTKSGRAFLVLEAGGDDLVVPDWAVGAALHGDRVEARTLPQRKDERPTAEIIKVVERKTTSTVGKYYHSRFHSFVIPDDQRLKIEINVDPPKGTQLRDGTKVVVLLEEWTNPKDYPRGKILQVLGMPGDKDVDVLSTVYKFKLPTQFPQLVVKESEDIPAAIPASEIKKRLDLRNTVTFTIDPEDAKDHDDAVSIEEIKEGYRLGVHIADVSHYVQANSKLDKEARQRTASAYLVDRVLPMLPERLSNDLCSLREKTDRLTLSLMVDLDRNGNVIRQKIHESIIRSHAKLSYEQVQDFLDGGEVPGGNKKIAACLTMMHALAKKMIELRERLGSVDFDLPEYKVYVDELGLVARITKRQRKMSNRIIEEFMLLANRLVAGEMLGRSIPTLFRIHPPPNEEKLANFEEFARSFGHRVSFGSPPQPKQIAEFIKSIEGRTEADLLNELLVRSMQKATYSPDNIGHFGLAFPHYLHFTSPIRRYPDLIVHRILKQVLNGQYQKSQGGPLKSSLARIGKHCTEQEIVIMEAERETIAVKQAEYLSRQLGEIFDGVISGMLGFGFFVRLNDIGAEGMVRLANMEDDYYSIDTSRYLITGKRTGRKYHLGDKVRVQVANVMIEAGQIDFRLIQEPIKKKIEAHSYRNRRRWR